MNPRPHTWRTTIAPMGGRFMLGVSAENRAPAGVAAGDVVDVELSLDTAPREVEHVRSVTEAKAPATRERRIAKAVEAARARLG
jgi:hypothetical protein